MGESEPFNISSKMVYLGPGGSDIDENVIDDVLVNSIVQDISSDFEKLSRRKRRRKNRENARNLKRDKRVRDLDSYDKVFTYDNLYQSHRLCTRGVKWKASIQIYSANKCINIHETLERLKKREFYAMGFCEFDIFERGKKRHIRSVCIYERVVQRCLCDHSLVPMLSATFIYDNGASMKNKGIEFAIKRMNRHLSKYFRKYGSDGYILNYDFSKYFDNINHDELFRIIDICYKDEDIKNLIKEFISAFGDIGLGLGSQVSQILSLAAASSIDHYMKEVLHCELYGRYMDDGYIIAKSKRFLQKCLLKLKELCDKLKITLNTKKTKIRPLHRGFTFLKVRFYLQSSGRILRKICHTSVVRMRRKLKKFKDKVDKGLMHIEDVYQSVQSWVSHTKKTNSYKTRRSMLSLYRTMFRDYIFTFENMKENGGYKYALQGA